jgi:hypothetical protein
MNDEWFRQGFELLRATLSFIASGASSIAL